MLPSLSSAGSFSPLNKNQYSSPDCFESLLKDDLETFRLNKIGKNPHMVSERETLVSDCQQMNDIVAALSAADNDSLDSLPSRWIGWIG